MLYSLKRSLERVFIGIEIGYRGSRLVSLPNHVWSNWANANMNS